MNASFADIHAAADFIGPGAIEVPLYQTEIFDICRRSSPFGQRIKQVPATGHPSRFFEETALPNPGMAGFVNPRSIVAPVVSPTRVERSVPLKAIVSQINYNLFDVELGNQQQQFAYLQAKDLVDTVSGVMVSHDVALWNGNDTSLSSPTTTQYMGAIPQIVSGGQTTTIGTSASIVDGIKSAVAQMVANNGYHVRPTAIYANPVLLDLIDREMKSEFNVVLNSDQITGGFRVKMLSTQAGDLPLIPDWSLSYTGTPGSGSAVLPAYIVTEDLIEYHWLGDASRQQAQGWTRANSAQGAVPGIAGNRSTRWRARAMLSKLHASPIRPYLVCRVSRQMPTYKSRQTFWTNHDEDHDRQTRLYVGSRRVTSLNHRTQAKRAIGLSVMDHPFGERLRRIDAQPGNTDSRR
jgi:hypothetical protein